MIQLNDSYKIAVKDISFTTYKARPPSLTILSGSLYKSSFFYVLLLCIFMQNSII